MKSPDTEEPDPSKIAQALHEDLYAEEPEWVQPHAMISRDQLKKKPKKNTHLTEMKDGQYE
jgi:hypothetical protein